MFTLLTTAGAVAATDDAVVCRINLHLALDQVHQGYELDQVHRRCKKELSPPHDQLVHNGVHLLSTAPNHALRQRVPMQGNVHEPHADTGHTSLALCVCSVLHPFIVSCL